MLPLVFTCVFIIWAMLAMVVLFGKPNIKIWRPRNPTVAIIATMVGLIGIVIGNTDPNAFNLQTWRFLVSLAPEMVGMAFAVVVIDELNQLRLEQQEKKALILQMSSPMNLVATEAVRILHAHGWLSDGSLIGVKLEGVSNLEGAGLWKANLRKGSFIHTNFSKTAFFKVDMEEADLGGANLSKAYLFMTNLRHTHLYKVNFRGACFQGVDMTGADLSDASLENVYYDAMTIWPDGFNPNTKGACLATDEKIDAMFHSFWDERRLASGTIY